MRKTITIRNRVISEEQPVFIIAEAGVTCNYDMKTTKELIDVVHEAGADAIKFFFLFPDEVMSDRTVTYTYETLEGTKSENMYEMFLKLRFSLKQWHEIKAYATKKDVTMFATVSSPSGVGLTETLGLEAYKLSSWDYNHLPLWRQVAAQGRPMLIDTGPVNTLDVAKVMQLMRDAGNDQSVLLHCYHTEIPAEINMRAIPYMRQAFNTLVGFSASDQKDEPDVMAIALGAVVLEKRLTMSRKLPGHHHILSKEPKEFVEYVKKMRDAQSSLGVYDLRPSPADLQERKKYFRHLVAHRDIPKGTILTADMLEGKRPAKGISPEFMDLFIGRATTRDLKYNEALTWDCV
jgi:N,N'-diacetyllegionaminate synthase